MNVVLKRKTFTSAGWYMSSKNETQKKIYISYMCKYAQTKTIQYTTHTYTHTVHRVCRCPLQTHTYIHTHTHTHTQFVLIAYHVNVKIWTLIINIKFKKLCNGSSFIHSNVIKVQQSCQKLIGLHMLVIVYSFLQLHSQVTIMSPWSLLEDL